MSAPKVHRLQAAALGLVGLLALALSGLLSPRAAPRYTVTDLGVLPGSTVSSASGINNTGEVVGVSGPGRLDLRHAFLYRAGVMTDLGRFGLINLKGGPAISDRGQVAGVQEVLGMSGRQFHASVYSGGQMHDLGALPGSSLSIGSGINAGGQVVGSADRPQSGTGGPSEHTFLYSGGSMVDIGTLPGCATSMPTGINAAGQIVGCAERQSGGSGQAFLYDSRTRKMTVLATPLGFTDSLALGINDHAQIIGTAAHSGSLHREQAVLWAAGQAAVLRLLPGRDSAEGAGINNRGEAVGATWTVPGTLSQFVNNHPIRLSSLLPLFDLDQVEHAFIYRDGKTQDLNELIPAEAGWTLQYARAINDQGQIVGQGLHQGQARAFLLTPIR